METAQEIFNRYFSKDVIIHNQEDFERLVILPAMEAYALQQAQLTFAAAREIDAKTGNRRFAGFEEYRAAQQTPAEETDEETDNKRSIIENVADSILPQYIPADSAVTTLSFSFTTEGSRYTATYGKDAAGYWQFDTYFTD